MHRTVNHERPAALIRVASVPASHVYVRHLAGRAPGDGVVRLPDVAPRDGCTVPGGWWPPAMLDPDWIGAHAREFDVFHVQFGFDTKSRGDLEEVVDALRTAGKPLVYTVHDLRNPHHPDRSLHDAQLGVLVPAADRLLTLTSGAARVIRERWNRGAMVLPHPHVVDWARLSAPRTPHQRFVVGVHAKSLRANMDPLAVAEALAGIVGEMPSATLRVDLHDEVFDPQSHWYEPDVGLRLRAMAAAERIDLRVHRYFTDQELWDYLGEIDVSVLPYRFGTHSGWMEACFDLGTLVIAPSCGFYAEQRPCLQFGFDEEHLDVESLARAVRVAYDQRPAWRASVRERSRERAMLAAAHRALYGELRGKTEK